MRSLFERTLRSALAFFLAMAIGAALSAFFLWSLSQARIAKIEKERTASLSLPT